MRHHLKTLLNTFTNTIRVSWWQFHNLFSMPGGINIISKWKMIDKKKKASKLHLMNTIGFRTVCSINQWFYWKRWLDSIDLRDKTKYIRYGYVCLWGILFYQTKSKFSRKNSSSSADSSTGQRYFCKSIDLVSFDEWSRETDTSRSAQTLIRFTIEISERIIKDWLCYKTKVDCRSFLAAHPRYSRRGIAKLYVIVVLPTMFPIGNNM